MPHDDFEIEPVRGLPAPLPPGEEILWQGRPATWALAREALGVRWVAGYFILLALWRFGSVVDLMPLGQALGATLPMLIIGAVAVGLLWLIALAQARATVYTVTTKRVVMRIGAALNVTFNLPYTQIGAADLALRRDGTGTISFTTLGPVKLSYLICWPHVRPWRMNPTQPALRAIPDADRVARLIGEAAQARITEPRLERRAAPATAPTTGTAPAAAPAGTVPAE